MTEAPVEISVVIPCWNVEPYLARCLESLFAALPANAEVIVVDDGSTDGTLAVLESFAKDEPRLKVIARPHRGVSAARNAALDEARGRLVFFVDPDDSVLPGYFSAMADALERALAGVLRRRLVPLMLELDLQEARDAVLVLDNEDTYWFARLICLIHVIPSISR